MKKIKPYLVNTLIVVVIFLSVLMLSHISPFGNYIIGKSDAIAQYKPMLYNFLTSLKHGILEIYSFNNGLGNPFMFNYTYYLISPLNLIGIIFKNGDLMYLSVIIIKIIFTSIFTTYYAKKHNCTDFTSFIATISYVFSSWFLAYYYNIMWLDTFMIFPLFQYGLEQLIKENKIYIYIFSLAYLYLTNFFLAFSVLLYGLIYYIIRNFIYEEKNIKEKLKNTGLFIISTLISLLLIIFYIYILIKVKSQTGLGASDITEAGYTVSTLDFIKSLFYGSTSITTAFSGPTYPNIASNTIILISLFYFFLNKKISIKNKVFTIIGLNIALASIFIKDFNYVLNMFHNTIELTYRYSFIIIFLSITLFLENSKAFDIKDKNKIICIFPFILLLLIINYKTIDYNIFIFNLIFILAYLVLTIFYNDSKYYKILLSIILIVQTTYACYTSISTDIPKENITYDKFLTETTKYRVNTIGENDFLNKNMYTNENATYLFSSMTYTPILNLTYKLGCNSGSNSISCHKDNSLFNMIFNVKNDYYLEKIYSVNKDIKNTILDETSIKNAQESLIEGMTGITNIFTKETLNATIKDNISTFKTDHSFYLIDYTEDNYTKNYVQDYKEFTYDNKNNDILNSVDIYIIENKTLEKIYNTLKTNQISYTKYSDSYIEGTIKVNENQMIFTSIPYDESWEIKIDDKIIKPTIILESLIGIECTPGEHKISLEYKTNYKIPIIISLLTLISLIISIIIKQKKNEK